MTRKIRPYFSHGLAMFALASLGIIFGQPTHLSGQVTADVKVIIEKLPLEFQEKTRDLNAKLNTYIETARWADADALPQVNVSVQMFLTHIPSNVEDRYKCEFLISSSDVQYFDKRVRFAYDPTMQLTYNEQSFNPLTGVVDFYMNMILGSELDKYSTLGGDVHYKRALNIASLGKFTRPEFVFGWDEREQLAKRVFQEPFVTFRKMKDYYFYGLYIKDEDLEQARQYLRQALKMIEVVMQKQQNLEEPKQFLDAHYLTFLKMFKDAKNKSDVFEKLMELDPDHKELYEEHVSKS